MYAFNAQFNHIQKQRKQNAVLRQTGQGPDFIGENILMLAESEYRDMLNDNTWTGIHTKGSESIFQVGGSNTQETPDDEGPECWNGCGGRHMVQDCKKPMDQKRVEANQKKYSVEQAKKGRGTPGGNNGGRGCGRSSGPCGRGTPRNSGFKWARPRSDENNKRIIDGHPHTFHEDNQHWSMDQEQAPAAAPVTPPNAVHFAAGTADRTPTAGQSDEHQQALFQQATLLKRVQGDLSDLASIQSSFFDSL